MSEREIEQDLESEAQEQEKGGALVEIYDWIESITYAVLIIVVAFTFLFKIVTVDGSSMVPTFIDGEKAFISNVGYTPKPGDVVVVSQPHFNHTPLIKRIIATEGMEVNIDFDRGIVYVDGQALEEPYIAEPTSRQGDVQFPLVVDEGCVFVMGDNRNNSTDSRFSIVGEIDVRNVLGRVYLRVFPFSKFGVIH